MKMQLRRFFGQSGEEGQAVVLMAIVMLTLLFAVGLAIDAGQLYAAKRAEQEAADAAAFAGAVVLYQNGTGAQAIAAATADALKNGYFTDPVGCTSNCTTLVEVYWPPTSGAYAGNNRHVEVVITHKVRTALVPAQSVLNPVRARGVAGAEALNNGYAIMALDRGNVCGAFETSDNGDLHLTGGGILVNSSCSSAAENEQNNASRFTIQSPYGLDVNGNAIGSWGSIGIPVTPGHSQVDDPFAQMPTPQPTDQLWGGGTAPTCNSLAACQDVLGNQTPGVYTVNLGGAGGSNMTLNPGIYILKAGMDTAGNANVTGSGILLFNTYSTYPAVPGASPSCGSINLQGNAASVLSAMTTGTWANLLVYQDPACTNEMMIGGNGTFTGTGSVYLPNAPFRFDGNPSTLNGSQLIAQRVNIQNGNITINYDPATTAQPILPRLAE